MHALLQIDHRPRSFQRPERPPPQHRGGEQINRGANPGQPRKPVFGRQTEREEPKHFLDDERGAEPQDERHREGEDQPLLKKIANKDGEYFILLPISAFR